MTQKMRMHCNECGFGVDYMRYTSALESGFDNI